MKYSLPTLNEAISKLEASKRDLESLKSEIDAMNRIYGMSASQRSQLRSLEKRYFEAKKVLQSAEFTVDEIQFYGEGALV